MQTWRWRLCVVAPDGESFYASEITLPAIDAETVLDDADEVAALVEEPLPIAHIIFSANAPEDEIINGRNHQWHRNSIDSGD